MGKKERIREIRDEINRVVIYGDMVGIQVIINGFTEMLLELADGPVLSDEDVDRIARRMLDVFMRTPIERSPIVFTGPGLNETITAEPLEEL